jgi:hypothetical protein
MVKKMLVNFYQNELNSGLKSIKWETIRFCQSVINAAGDEWVCVCRTRILIGGLCPHIPRSIRHPHKANTLHNADSDLKEVQQNTRLSLNVLPFRIKISC